MSGGKDDSGNEREFVRIEDIIPLEVMTLGRDYKGAVKAREIFSPAPVEQTMPEGYEPEDSRILRYLSTINAKLDLLINQMVTETGSIGDFDSRRVSLSACGISFPMDKKPEDGELIEVKMLLPGPASVAVCLYGEVVRVEDEPSEDGAMHRVAAKFVGMEEEIREHIMKYVFNRQREHIRKSRETP